MKYIDKSALAAEIEKIIADETESIKSFEHSKNVSEVQRSNGRLSVLHYIRSFLDTIEVKEVDSNDAFIEKVINFLNYKLDDVVTTRVPGTIIPHPVAKQEFIEDFKNYMKGE